MYSPLMHFVPVETQMTCASFTSVPVGGGEKYDTLAKGQTSDMDKSVILERTYTHTQACVHTRTPQMTDVAYCAAVELQKL